MAKTLLAAFLPILFVSSFSSHSLSHESNSKLSKRLIVTLKSATNKNYFTQKLPKGAKVIDSFDKWVIIEFKEPVTPGEFAEVHRFEHVQNARYDLQVQSNQATGVCHTCATETQKSGTEIQARVLLDRVSDANLKRCPIDSQCPQSGRAEHFGQIEVDGDLMRATLQSWGNYQGSVKGAVVDTGFDHAGNRKNMTAAKVNYSKGPKWADDPRRDPTGHGTSVASLIIGDSGIGLAPFVDFTSYRVDGSKKDPEGKASDAGAMMSLLRACADGNEVINFSMTTGIEGFGRAMSIDRAKEESIYSEAMDYFSERGCLVIKAAGNQGDKAKFGSNDLFDPYLRVGATGVAQRSGELAAFSNTGEINAPGSFINTLQSQGSTIQAGIQADHSQQCGGTNTGLLHGTSFAAPIVHAIASSVVAVLRNGEKKRFDDIREKDKKRLGQKSPYFLMSGPERIKLVNAILQASVHNGVVNGLRAIHIAKAWKDNKTPKSSSLLELNSLLQKSVERQGLCRPDGKMCSTMTECNGLAKCFKEKRSSFALCEDSPSSLRRDLILTAMRAGNLDIAAIWLKNINDREELNGDDIVALENSSYWKTFPEEKNELSLSIRYLKLFETATGTYTAETHGRLSKAMTERLLNSNTTEAPNTSYLSYFQELVDASDSIGLLPADSIKKLVLSENPKISGAALQALAELGLKVNLGEQTVKGLIEHPNTNKQVRNTALVMNLIHWKKFSAPEQIFDLAIGSVDIDSEGLSIATKVNWKKFFLSEREIQKRLQVLLDHRNLDSVGLEGVALAAGTFLTDESVTLDFIEKVKVHPKLESSGWSAIAKSLSAPQMSELRSYSMLINTIRDAPPDAFISFSLIPNLMKSSYSKDQKYQLVDTLLNKKTTIGYELIEIAQAALKHPYLTEDQRVKLLEKTVAHSAMFPYAALVISEELGQSAVPMAADTKAKFQQMLLPMVAIINNPTSKKR